MSDIALSALVVRFVARSACCNNGDLGGGFLPSDAFLRARHTPFSSTSCATGQEFPVSGNAARPRRNALHATRHTPLLVGSTLDNFVTSSLNACITSFKYITSDLYLFGPPLLPAFSELALQAASRLIDEKWPYSSWVYDWSSRRLSPHIWLRMRLLGIPTGVLALSGVFIHNQNLWVMSLLVEHQHTNISYKNACPAGSLHQVEPAADSTNTQYSSKNVGQGLMSRGPDQTPYLVVAGALECWMLGLRGAASKPHPSKYILSLFGFLSVVFSSGSFSSYISSPSWWLFLSNFSRVNWLLRLFYCPCSASFCDDVLFNNIARK